MTKYKNRFRSKINDFNYDLLISNPNQEIKSLISKELDNEIKIE